MFRVIADILEIKDENFFRIRAYRNAAGHIENLTQDLNDFNQAGLQDIPGVGADLSAKIIEMLKSGKLEYFEELKKSIPCGLLDIMDIPGIGPKTTKLLYEKLRIDSIDSLEKAARSGLIAGLPGLKEKTQENILKGILLIKQKPEKILFSYAQNTAENIISSLKKLKEIKQACIAGSLRRGKETVRDIDILAASLSAEKAMELFTGLDLVKDVIAKGPAKSSIRTKDGIQVDLRVVDPKSFGAALVYFTGSKEHNIRIRELAKKNNLKINEYGVFDLKTDKIAAAEKEEDIYAALGLSFIPPELREDRGEVEAAKIKKLPKLITLSDIKADLHVHSEWSDGNASISVMAETAFKKGYEYMVISDHSQGLGIARGLNPQRLYKQIDEIKTLNKKFKKFRILSAAEVDIKSDGTLDFSEDVLKDLDVVLAAVHSGFKQSSREMTKRLVKAMENRYVNIIVHPTGRLINERPRYEFDFEEVVKTAKDTNTALEINCYPKRLDLDDIHARRAKQEGVRISLGTDAHSAEQFEFMRLGVMVGRRAWLEKKDVLNCLSCEEFLKKIKKD